MRLYVALAETAHEARAEEARPEHSDGHGRRESAKFRLPPVLIGRGGSDGHFMARIISVPKTLRFHTLFQR